MASAVLTATRDTNIEPDTNGRHQIVYGKIAVDCVTGTDYATGGLVLDLTSVGPFGHPPLEVKVWSDALANGYAFRYIPDAAPTIANGKLAVFQGTATAVPFAQIAASTLPAAIGTTGAGGTTVGALRFKAIFRHGQ